MKYNPKKDLGHFILGSCRDKSPPCSREFICRMSGNPKLCLSQSQVVSQKKKLVLLFQCFHFNDNICNFLCLYCRFYKLAIFFCCLVLQNITERNEITGMKAPSL